MDAESLRFCAMDLEAKYFGDMTLRDELGDEMNGVLDGYGCPVHPSIERVRFEIAELPDDTLGVFDAKRMSITLDSSSGLSIPVLAHEMIHFYVHELGDMAVNARDVIMLSLYDRLSGVVPDLMGRVSSAMEFVFRNAIEGDGGDHGVLFLLKSYDMDMHLGVPLGTVHGYYEHE